MAISMPPDTATRPDEARRAQRSAVHARSKRTFPQKEKGRPFSRFGRREFHEARKRQGLVGEMYAGQARAVPGGSRAASIRAPGFEGR